MGIVPQFTKEDVKKRFDKFIEVVEEEQIKLLEYLGEKCVIEARTNHTYTDQTGALNSSTGYVIFKDGEALKADFRTSPGANQDKAKMIEDGATIGMELAENVGKEIKGLALVVVAGMHYAIYVESKGFNVLASAEHLAEQELPKMIADLIKDIKTA